MVAAPDPVGCWGAVEILRRDYGISATVLTGPATDNEVGLDYIRTNLNVPAHNARRDAAGLVTVVRKAVEVALQRGPKKRIHVRDSEVEA